MRFHTLRSHKTVSAKFAAAGVFFVLYVMCLPLRLHAQDAVPDVNDYTNYTNPLDPNDGYFQTEGNAESLGSRCYLITEDRFRLAGQLWWSKRINVQRNLVFKFVLDAGTKDSGADGFAFVMHNDSRELDAIGSVGRYLGYSGNPGTVNSTIRQWWENDPHIRNSMALEIDTHPNPASDFPDQADYSNCQDPVYDHLALVTNSNICEPEVVDTIENVGDPITQANFVRIYPGVDNVEDSSICYEYAIYWTFTSSALQRIDVFVDDVFRMGYEGNIISQVFSRFAQQRVPADTSQPERFPAITADNGRRVYIGFTGSTGAYHNEQSICLVVEENGVEYNEPIAVDDVETVVTGQTTILDVVANDKPANPEFIRESLVVGAVIPNTGSEPTKGTVSAPLRAVVVRQDGISTTIVERRVRYIAPINYVGEDSFSYKLCDDPQGNRCISRCTEGAVTLNVACPDTEVSITKLNDDARCDDSLPSRGGARGTVRVTLNNDTISYSEDFSRASEGDRMGERLETINNTPLLWSLQDHEILGETKTGEGVVYRDSRRFLATNDNAPENSSFELVLTFTTPPNLRDVFNLNTQPDDPDRQKRVNTIAQFAIGSVRPGRVIGEIAATISRTDAPDVIIPWELNGSSLTEIDDNFTVGEFFYLTASTALSASLAHTINIRVSLTSDSSLAGLSEQITLDGVNVIFTLDSNPTQDISGDYTFRWYQNDIVPDPMVDMPVYEGSEYLQMIAGTYTLQAESTITPGCYTAPAQVTINRIEGGDDQLLEGTATVTETAALTRCSPPNGALTASVTLDDGTMATDGYTYAWRLTREGDVIINTTQTASDLNAEGYIVTITEESTGCRATNNLTVSSAVYAPTVEISSQGDDSNCGDVTNATGFVELSINDSRKPAGEPEDTNGTWRLYQGDLNFTAADPSEPNRFDELQAGTYSATYTRSNTSGCTSDEREVIIGSTSPQVTISTSSMPNTYCSLPYTGSIVTESSVGGNAPGTSGFTFSYYAGSGVNASSLIDSQQPGGDAPYVGGSSMNTLFRVEGGQYTVSVLDTNTGCTQTADVAVLDQLSLPTIDASLVDITGDVSCAVTGGTGSIDASSAVSGGVSGNYNYVLYAQPGRTPEAENTSGIFTALSDGGYELLVTDTTTNCVSTSSFLTVLPIDNLMLTTTNVVANRSCSTTIGTGSFSGVASATQVTPYAFSLYASSTTTGTPISSFPNVNASTQSFNDLLSGTYTVQVGDGYGCVADLSVTISSVTAKPTLLPVPSVTARSSCGVTDGAILANVTNWEGAAVSDPAGNGYQFAWRANDALGPLLSSTGARIDNLSEGTYVVTVINALDCRSDSLSVDVLQNAEIPVPVIAVSSPLSACQQSDADGELSVSLSPAIVSSVTYEWFSGTVAGASGSGTTGDRLSVWEGDYAMRATTAVGCEGTTTFNVRSGRISPQIIQESVVDNTACSPPPNGSIGIRLNYDSVAVNDLTDYTFTLDGAVNTPTADGVGVFKYDGLGAGTYAISSTYKGCSSNVLNATVSDFASLPNFTATLTASTSCDTANHPNGAITLTPADGSAVTDYAYSWSTGNTYDATDVLGDTNTISTLAPGTYSVQIKRNGCTLESTYTLSHMTSPVPSFDAFAAELVGSCAPFDGRLTAQLAGVSDYSLYEWYWYEGDSEESARLLPSGSDLTFSSSLVADHVVTGLRDGTFSVYFVEKSTHCRSPLTSSALSFTPDATFTVTPTLDTAAGDCTGSAGTVDVAVSNTAGHTFDLRVYQGDLPTIDASAIETNSSLGVLAGSTTQFSLASNIYTIAATDTATGCRGQARFSMPYQNAPVVVDITQVNNTPNCLPYLDGSGRAGAGGAKGSLEVEFSIDDTNPDNHSAYWLFLYGGVSAAPTPDMTGAAAWAVDGSNNNTPINVQAQQGVDVTPDASGSKVDTYPFSDLGAGSYTVIAAKIGETACFSAVVTRDVISESDALVIAPSAISTTDNTTCSGTANGSLTIASITRGIDTDSSATELGSYSYAWSLSNTYSPLLPQSSYTANDLSAGDYYIRITKTDDLRGNDEGCELALSASIGSDIETLSIEDTTPTDITSCSGLTAGSIVVDAVTAGGSMVPFSGLSASYEVRTEDLSGNTLTTLTPTSATLSALSAGTYSLQLWNTSTACNSPADLVQVEDDRIYPDVDLSASLITPLTNCTSADGAITAMLAGTLSPGDVAYAWYAGNTTTPPLLGTAETLSDRSAGPYALQTTHNVSNCTRTSTFVLPDERVYPVLQIAAADALPNTFCVGENGSVQVERADVTPLGDYTIALLEGVTTRGTLTLDATTTEGSFNGLGASNYALIVTSLLGCENATAPTIEVEAKTDEPIITEIITTDDVGCLNGLGVANVAVVIGEQDADRNSVADTYAVTIDGTTRANVATRHGEEGLTGPTIPYTVHNEASGCEIMGDATLGPSKIPDFFISELAETPLTQCDPANGSASVLSVIFHETTHVQTAGAASVFGDYTFEWADNTSSVLAPSGEPYTLTDLAAEEAYSINMTHTSTGCEVTRFFTLGTDLTYPLISTEQLQADQSCAGGSPDGIVAGLADGQDDSHPDYRFSWRDEGGNEVSTASQPSGLAAGTYTLIATNNTGCSAENTLLLPNEPLVFFIDDVTITALTICEPGDASLLVNSLSYGQTTDYTYALYDQIPATDPTPAPIQTATGTPNFSGLSTGPYYLRTQHTTLRCEHLYSDIKPPNEATPPTVVLENASLQSLCDPNRGNGELLVSPGEGTDLADYAFKWYDEAGNLLKDEAGINGLLPGVYRVEVKSNITGCVGERFYTMQEAFINPLALNAYASGNAQCREPYTGVLAADVLYSLEGQDWRSDYSFYWRKGTTTPTPKNHDYEGYSIEALNAGVYTLAAYHKEDPTCQSVPLQVNVPDLREFPQVEVEVLNPLSNCDEQKPNGQLRAALKNGKLVDYTFLWTKGSLGGEALSNSSLLHRQGAGEYFLKVTENVSRCSTTDSHTLAATYQNPLPPNLLLEKNSTSCNEPNGRVRAEYATIFDPYVSFEWHKEPSSKEQMPFNVGEVAEGLAGEYSVYSFDQESGCYSQAPARITVYDSVLEVAYTIETRNSYCSRPTGQARIFVEKPVRIQKVVWHLNGQTIESIELFDVPPGDYQVTITDEAGCETKQDFSIGVDVLVYNGLSDNADGNNDRFLIDCIEQFPNNRVSLYNNDGVLVFQKNGYRNENAFMFNGSNATRGNSTLYGTYFYVVELGNGKKPLAGYLEILR